MSHVGKIGSNKLLVTGPAGVLQGATLGGGLTLSGGTISAAGGGPTVYSYHRASGDTTYTMPAGYNGNPGASNIYVTPSGPNMDVLVTATVAGSVTAGGTYSCHLAIDGMQVGWTQQTVVVGAPGPVAFSITAVLDKAALGGTLSPGSHAYGFNLTAGAGDIVLSYPYVVTVVVQDLGT